MTGRALTTIDLVPADIKAGTAHMAFPIYETIPPGCVPWPVMGDRHAPPRAALAGPRPGLGRRHGS